jgi:hypothetical protein
MILECSCGKMYRVKDDAANPPKNCPSCGSPLKAHSGGGPPSAVGADPKAKELEGKLKAAEKDLSSAKATADLKEKELREAQASISRLGSDLEKAQSSYKDALRKKEQEVEEKQKKIAELEGEGTKVRQQSSGQAMSLLKQKDAALQEARERVTQLEEELAAGGKKGAPAEVESRLKELEAEVETGRESRAKLAEEMAKEKDAFRDSLKEKVKELEASEARAVALEKKMVEIAGGDPKTPAEERARQRIAQLEKIVGDGEKRYRDLLSKVEEQGASAADVKALAAKDQELMAARSSLHSEQSRRESLERRIAELEKARAAAPAERRESSGGTRVQLDLDRNLSTISASLQVLVDKVKSLQRGLNESAPAAEPAPGPAEETPAREGPYAPVEPAAEANLEPPDELVDAAEEPEEAPEPAEAAEAAEEPVAEAKEDVAQLETLPLPDEEPSALPQDETLLDMGGYKRRRLTPKPSSPPAEDAPLSAEVSPGPLPEEGAEAEGETPKKKGFFGKLFGKKK